MRKNALNKIMNSSRLIKSASKELIYHYENNISVVDNIFRPGSEEYFRLIREAKQFVNTSIVKEADMDILNTDIGEFGVYEGKKVPLDFPMEENVVTAAKYQGKDVKLNSPVRGGSKKFYVYAKCNGKVKKISFGSKEMKMKICNDEARKSFVARHKCASKKDKCTAGYWACAMGRFPKLSGCKKKYRYW
jgi:hypothetical protein